MAGRGERLSLGLLACAALASNIFWASTQTPISADSESYIAPARNLLAGRGFSSPDPMSYAIAEFDRRLVEKPDAFRTPGYPLVLALAMLGTGGATAVIPLQILVNASIPFALLRFTRAHSGDVPTAHAAGWLYALHPPPAMLAGQVMSETLFTAAVFASIVLVASLLRARDHTAVRAALAGFVVGLSVLIRPVTHFLFIPLALVIALLTRRRPIVATLVFTLFALAPPALWMARNLRVSGVATISSNAGDDMLFWRAAGALAADGRGVLYGLTALQVNNDFHRRLLALHRQLLASAKEEVRASGQEPDALNHAQRAQVYGRMGRELVLRHLDSYILVAASGAVTMLVDVLRMPMSTTMHPSDAAVVFVPIAAAMFASALLGVAGLWKRHRPLAVLAVVVVAYFTGISASGGTQIRYAIPMAPMYCMLVAAGVRFRRWGEEARA